MRKLLLFALAFVPFLTSAQTITFETLSLPGTDTFYVNSLHHLQDDGFTVGMVHFPYVYDTSYGGFWTAGFAYSNKKDSVTSGPANMYAAKAGRGNNNSDKYVVFTPGYDANHNLYIPQNPNDTTSENHSWSAGGSMYVTNTTYAYNSMRNGDGLAKKFGGANGKDPDWFKLTVRGFRHRGAQATQSGSLDVYLADFRSAVDSLDYILKDWKRVDLAPLNGFDSLDFSLSSSDTNMYGMLTPAYFCMDDLSLNVPTGIQKVPAQNIAKVFPNPAISTLFVEIQDAFITQVAVYDVAGRLMTSQAAGTGRLSINTATFAPGMYLLKLEGPAGTASVRFMKQ